MDNSNMKRSVFKKLLITSTLTIVTSFSMGCNKKKHIHVLTDWFSNATEHWRYCTTEGCSSPRYEEREKHVGYPCEICGPCFKAVAFYTGIDDAAHVSFCNEAKEWFKETAETHNFLFESTNNWDNLNDEFLEDVDIVLFLDTRPEKPSQREAFERYMENGGGWIGFHFAAFALTPSSYPQDWDWYHENFLGAGQYVSNTWEPTTATLKVETHNYPGTENIPDIFEATACEWYRWEHDLRENEDIEILCSIHPSSFPLGTGPKEYEIWYEGYYPVVWTNINYNMLYMNMGHNRMDYGTNTTLSYTFSSEIQNRLVIDSMFGMVGY